jgi:carboxymethylenebutenolidase
VAEARPPVPFFLARPADFPPGPGVVVLMEGTGISPQLLRVCERLAAEGYAAIAPDLFHHLGGSNPDRLPEQFLALRSEDALADIRTCVAELRQLGATTVGVTGFCMGGRLTYEAAVDAVDVEAAAAFYGARIGRLLGDPRCPLLCFFGGTDEYIPAEEIAAVEAHHPGRVVVYPQAGHGFMRDGSPSYDAAAATDAWRRLLDFFAEHLH